MVRKCPVCGAEFTGHPNKIYCGKSCKQRAIYLRHREQKLRYQKEYDAAHREKIKAYNREYYRKYYWSHKW